MIILKREDAEKKRNRLEKLHDKYGHIRPILFILNLRMRYLMFRRDTSKKIWDGVNRVDNRW